MADIRHTLVIEASPGLIYQALTTADGLSAWWTPGTQAIPEIGSIARFPFEAGYVKQMEVVALKTDEFVQWHCIQGDKEWIGTVLTFQLELLHEPSRATPHPEVKDPLEQGTAGVKTMLMFAHKDWKEYSASFAECSYTWAIFLRSLKLYCETGIGRPWPNQHQLY